MNKKGFLAWLSLLLSSLLFASYVSASGEVLSVNASSATTIEQATGNQVRSFPHAYSIDSLVNGKIVKKVFVSFARNTDPPQGPSIDAVRVSTDGGQTFPTVIQDLQTMNMIKKRDGSIVSVRFDTFPVSGNPYQVTSTYFTSTNDGVNWEQPDGVVPLTGTVTSGSQIDWLKFHRGIIELNDGSLLAPLYGKYVGDTKSRSVLAKSTDGGVNWNIITTIAYNPNLYVTTDTAFEGFDETSIVRCADGTLLAVMRVGNTRYPLYQSRSNDNGANWSTPVKLPGQPDSNIYSVDPALLLMPNGILVLSYGRPDNKILVSEDGNGTTWTNMTTTYTATSSDNTGIAVLDTNRLIQVGDTGASWNYDLTPFPSPNPFSIWKKTIDIVRNPLNKIDLKKKYEQGKISVATNMNLTDAAHPEARVEAAFDGSTNYWASAFKDNTAGTATFTIDLQKNYKLSNLGVSLKTGYAESANIYFSQDNVHWGDPVKTFTNKTHYAMEYTTFGVPITARYVKFESTSPGAGSALNEIELYSADDTFENDSLGPQGYTNLSLAMVAGFGYESRRSLRLDDNSTDAMARATKIVSDATLSKTLEFYVNPSAISTGILFDVLGQVTSGTTTIYHLLVGTDGSLSYHNGSAWNLLAGTAGTIPLNTWSKVRLDAKLTTASLYVNDLLKGTITTYVPAANVLKLDGYTFASGGTGTTGDTFYVDDVSFREFNSTTDTFENGTVGTVPAGYQDASLTAFVSTDRAFAGTKSLHLNDNSATAIAAVSKYGDAADSKVLEFQLSPAALASSFLFDILGQVTSGTASVYHLGVFSDGSVHYYNGSAWVPIAGVNTVALNAWNKIRVEANRTAANVYVNDTWIGTAGMYANPANVQKLNGIKFTSGGTVPVGDDVYVDNVIFGGY
ncbi:exo-alpha-sialidase [Paenibacillus sp. HJGM_3]|uniref:exo-alpha-sialidase n=1 Tax=Paenibacillus sp. HJGM_3 TaxID=3379816 RepID=UPI00385AFD66